MKQHKAVLRFIEPWLHLEEAAEIRRRRRKIQSVCDRIYFTGKNWTQEEISHENSRETDRDEDELASLESRRYERWAERAGMTIPGDFWEPSANSRGPYIPEERRSKLRLLIRQKRRELWNDRVSIFAPLLALLIGLLGAATGLVAALQSCNAPRH